MLQPGNANGRENARKAFFAALDLCSAIGPFSRRQAYLVLGMARVVGRRWQVPGVLELAEPEKVRDTFSLRAAASAFP